MTFVADNVTRMEGFSSHITKLYLETLSFDALVMLAEESGVDVPSGLSRSLLISDLLEVAEEEYDDENMATKEEETEDQKISDTCSPTYVALVASGPLWAFVYWNVGGRDALGKPALFLRINSFNDKNNVSGGEHLILDIEKNDTERFVLLPRRHKYIQIDLIAINSTEEDVHTATPIATSAIFELPRPSNLLLQSISSLPLSPMQELSGMRELLITHYRDYRSSLSATYLSAE